MTIQELKKFEDKIVVLNLTDGERLRVKLCWVDIEYDDIIVDVLETNQPQYYKDTSAAYAIPRGMVQSIELWESSK